MMLAVTKVTTTAEFGDKRRALERTENGEHIACVGS